MAVKLIDELQKEIKTKKSIRNNKKKSGRRSSYAGSV